MDGHRGSPHLHAPPLDCTLGQIALQTFEGDWFPLLLLLAISVTGLGMTWTTN